MLRVLCLHKNTAHREKVSDLYVSVIGHPKVATTRPRTIVRIARSVPTGHVACDEPSNGRWTGRPSSESACYRRSVLGSLAISFFLTDEVCFIRSATARVVTFRRFWSSGRRVEHHFRCSAASAVRSVASKSRANM